MSDSREDSPDWLRSFQAPIQSAIELSSDSELRSDHSPPSDDDDDSRNLSQLFKKGAKGHSDINDNDDGREYEAKKTVKGKSPRKSDKAKRTPEKKRKNEDDTGREGKRTKGKDSSRRNTADEHGKPHKHSISSVSSDSEYSPNARIIEKDKATKREISPDKDLITVNEKAENDTKGKFVKEGYSGKYHGPQGSSTKLRLVLSDKVQYSKALVECEGDSIDLSGDVGSVGRVVIAEDSSKNHELLLDLKGTIYKTTIIPSRTFCVVSFGQSEAKIEAIMNDYVQLKPQSNVYEAETMIEGTLDGFSFDSEDEADRTTTKADQHKDAEEEADGQTKGKPGKTPGSARKKGKLAEAKQPKKPKKKPQVSKKGRTKK